MPGVQAGLLHALCFAVAEAAVEFGPTYVVLFFLLGNHGVI